MKKLMDASQVMPVNIIISTYCSFCGQQDDVISPYDRGIYPQNGMVMNMPHVGICRACCKQGEALLRRMGTIPGQQEAVAGTP